MPADRAPTWEAPVSGDQICPNEPRACPSKNSSPRHPALTTLAEMKARSMPLLEVGDWAGVSELGKTSLTSLPEVERVEGRVFLLRLQAAGLTKMEPTSTRSLNAEDKARLKALALELEPLVVDFERTFVFKC